ADLAFSGPGQPRLALSSPPPPAAEGLAARRVETVGDRSGGQVLLPYARRSPRAFGREGYLGAPVRCSQPDLRGGQPMIRLFNWFRRGSLERGLARELQYHFDRRVADLTAAGIPEPEARRRVAVELGLAQVREEVRDVWLTRWLRDFLYDLRFSARSFLRSPGFTATTLLSLALGIGATTAIYSLVDQVILPALPVREPGRLVLVDWNGD